ncbi:DUF6479 family protein [Streptomyces sp. YIM S03343]
MGTASMQLAASGLLSIGLFVVAVAVVAVLAGGAWLTTRVRETELPRPRPEEQPHLPEGGAVHEVLENRESEEVVVEEGGRPLTPYELSNRSTRPSPETKRLRWSRGSSGSFGGGGLGAH